MASLSMLWHSTLLWRLQQREKLRGQHSKNAIVAAVAPQQQDSRGAIAAVADGAVAASRASGGGAAVPRALHRVFLAHALQQQQV